MNIRKFRFSKYNAIVRNTVTAEEGKRETVELAVSPAEAT